MQIPEERHLFIQVGDVGRNAAIVRDEIFADYPKVL
jgi:hypothetical protein